MADVFVVALQHFGSIFCLDPEGDKKKKKHAEHFYFILSGEGKKSPGVCPNGTNGAARSPELSDPTTR
jgi:hypothetical protein